jgi:hypothetical protein
MSSLIDVPIFYADKNKKFKKYISKYSNNWGYKLTDDKSKADRFYALSTDTFKKFHNKIMIQDLANGEWCAVKFRCIPYYLGLKFKNKYYICLKMNPFKYKLAKIKEFIRINPEIIKV